jgi:type I restriction enzyme S subunit
MKAQWKTARIGDVVVDNPKSKLKVRDSISDGAYPFYTSGVSINSCDDFLCDGKNIFLATGGKACVQYYEGKAAYSTDCYSLTTRADVTPKFFFYFLNSILADIEEHMFEGAALRHLQKTKFREIITPLPSLAEQQRIVGLLDEAFAGITTTQANSEKNRANTEEVYASVLETLFADLENDCDAVELGELIDTLTDYHANGSYEVLKKNVELKDTEDFAWMVRSTDFENNFQNEMRYITETGYEFLKKSRVLGGEIIMSKIGNAGKVYLMPEINRPCSLAMNLFLIRLKEDRASNKFVYRFLKSKRGEAQIQSRLKGVATQTITKDNVRSLRIPIPRKVLQDSIVSRLESVETETQRLASLYERKLAALEALKKSLLHQAFTGQLK